MMISASLWRRLPLGVVALAWLLATGTTLAAPPVEGSGVTDNGATIVPSNPSAQPPNSEPHDQSFDQAPPVAEPGASSQDLDKPPPPPKPNAVPEVPKNLESIKPEEVTTVLGQKVRGPDGKDIFGAIIDVLVDGNGEPRAAIIDFGGFLGVGSRKIAVDWRMLKFQPANHDAPISLSLDRAQIQAAPEYKDQTQPAEIVGPPPPAAAPADAGPQAN